MFTCGIERQVTLKHLTRRTQTKLLNTDYSSILGHNAVKQVKYTLVQALRLCTGCTAHRGSRGIALPFLDHGNRRGCGGQRHALAALYPREKPGTCCTGGWVGPRVGLDRCGKSRPPKGNRSPDRPALAIRYTDYATRPTEIQVLGKY